MISSDTVDKITNVDYRPFMEPTLPKEEIYYNGAGQPLPWEEGLVLGKETHEEGNACIREGCYKEKADGSAFCSDDCREAYWNANNPNYGTGRRIHTLREMQAKLKLWGFQAREREQATEKLIAEAQQIFSVPSQQQFA
jgi:hypothetical protein